jgi:hypothetical protein
MEGNSDDLASKVQGLGDLELAVLICLVADQHCIIQTEKELLYHVGEELKLVRPRLVYPEVMLILKDRHQCVWALVGTARMRRTYYPGRLWGGSSSQGGKIRLLQQRQWRVKR